MLSLSSVAARPIQRTFLSWFRSGVNATNQTLVTVRSSQNVPKRPGNPYTIFYEEHFPKIANANPDLPTKSIARMAGEKWRSLPEGEKKVYSDSFHQRLAAYQDAMNLLSDEEKASLKASKNLKKRRRNLAQKRKLLIELKKPKRPATAFFIFSAEENDSELAGLKLTERTSRLASKWKTMSDVEKEPFVKRYEVSLSHYLEEKAIWEQQMKEQGYEHLCAGYKKPKPPPKKKKKRVVAKKAAPKKKRTTKKKKMARGKRAAKGTAKKGTHAKKTAAATTPEE